MSRFGRRTVCVLLVVAMMLGIMPMSALGASISDQMKFKVYYKDSVQVYQTNSFQSAWTEVAKYGGTLEMFADAKLTYAHNVSADIEVTIQTNGHTIDRGLAKSASPKADGEMFHVKKNATLTVIGGTLTGAYNSDGGGAIDLLDNATLILQGVTITDNRTTDHRGGGAIRMHGDNSHVQMDADTVISNNHALLSLEEQDYYLGGGAISIGGENCTVIGSNTLITGNSSAYDGGGVIVEGSNCIVQGLNLQGNSTTHRGGGIHLWNEATNTKITDCYIEGNTAYQGAGIFIYSTGTSLSDSAITGNIAADLGGGIYLAPRNTAEGSNVLKLSGKLSAFGNVGNHIDREWDDNVYLHENSYEVWNSFFAFWETIFEKSFLEGEPDGPMVGEEKFHIGFDPSKDYDYGGFFMRYITKDAGVYYHRYLEVDLPGWQLFWGIGKSEIATHNSRALIATPHAELIPLVIGQADVPFSERYEILEDTFYGDTQLPIQHGLINFSGITGSDIAVEYYYSDGYFAEDPTKYNNHLATMSLVLAMAAMNSCESVDGMEKYQNKGRNIYQLLADLGFKSTDIYLTDSYEEKPSSDSIAVAFGAKELQGERKDGKPYILLPIAIRGAGYESEWASNLTMGAEAGTEAKGFSDTASLVEAYLEEFLNSDTSMDLHQALAEGRVRFWIAGFSRAGAVSNLLAKRLTEKYTVTVLGSDYDNQVFAYCFAAPRGGVTDTCKVEGSDELITHPNIHNVINQSDIVPQVYPWQMGFMRYGADHYMPGSEAGEMQEDKKTFTYQQWDQHYAWEKLYSVDYIYYRDNVPYNTNSAGYAQRFGTMIQHLRALDSTLWFSDNFRFANVEYMDGALMGNAFIQECDTNLSPYATAADWYEFFIQHFLEWGFSKNYLDGEIVKDYEYNFREYFTQERYFLGEDYGEYPTVQEALRTLVPPLFELSGNAEFMDAMAYRASDISTITLANIYYDGIIYAYECDAEEMDDLLNSICNIVMGYKSRDVYDEETGTYRSVRVPALQDFIPNMTSEEIKDSLYTILYVLLRFVNEDWWWDRWADASTPQQNTYLPGANGSQLHLGTLAYNMGNLIMNHYPEVYMAWLRGEDSYFTDPATGIKQKHAMQYTLVEPTVPNAEGVKIHINGAPVDAESTYSGKLNIKMLMPQDETESMQGSMLYYRLLTDGQPSGDWQMYNGEFSVINLGGETLTVEYKLIRFGVSGDVSTVTISTVPTAKYTFVITDNITWRDTTQQVYAGDTVTVTASRDDKIHKWGVRYDPNGPIVDMDPQPSNLKEFTVTAPDHYVQYVVYYYLPVNYIQLNNIKPIAGEPLKSASPDLYYYSGAKDVGDQALLHETVWRDSKGNTVPVGTVAVEGETYTAQVIIRCDETAGIDRFLIRDDCSIDAPRAKAVSKKITEGGTVITIDCQFDITATPVYYNIHIDTFDLNLYAPTTTPGQMPEGFEFSREEGEVVSVPAPVIEHMQFKRWKVSWHVADLNPDLDLTQPTLTFTMPYTDVYLTAEYIPIIQRVDVEIPQLIAGEPLPTAATSITATITNSYKLDPSLMSLEWTSHPNDSIVQDGELYTAKLRYNLGDITLEDGTELASHVSITDNTELYINGLPVRMSVMLNLVASATWHSSSNPELSVITSVSSSQTIRVMRDENNHLPETIQLPETITVKCSNALITSVPVEWSCDQEYSSTTAEKQSLKYYGTLILPENVAIPQEYFNNWDKDKTKEGFQVFQWVIVEGSRISPKPEAEIAIADDGTVTMTLLKELDSTKIYYTVDGSEPTKTSTLYTDPFVLTFVDGYATVKAIAVNSAGVSSEVATFTYTNKLPEKLVDRWNMRLEDDLVVNFYLNMQADEAVQITVDDEIVRLSASDLEQTEDGKYIASVRLAAAQMTADIRISLVGAVQKAATYTIREYADTVLADESLSQYHPLIKEMLNYGAMAQVYFDYDAENLANDGIIGVANADIPETAEEKIVSDEISSLNFYGASLLFRDRIAVRYYFTGDVTGCTFSANGNTYTPVAKDGLHYVEIPDILPQNLDQQITLTVTDANGNTLTVAYSPMNYIVRMNENGSDTLKALVKALYNYHLATKAL